MTEIRRATVEDLEAVVRLGTRLASESTETGGAVPNANQLAITARTFLESPRAGVFLFCVDGVPSGGAIFVLYEHFISGEPRAAEVCWWINPEARRGRPGLALLEAVSAWAGSAGARRLEVIGSRKPTVYERLGFTPSNRVYERSIPCHS